MSAFSIISGKHLSLKRRYASRKSFLRFPGRLPYFYFFLCISEAVLFRMDFKRNFVFSCTGGNTQPSAALISGLHSCSVHSIRYADCCTGKPAASGNKSAAGRRHIALDLFVFLCSKIEFSPDSLACLQGNLQPFLRKRRDGCPYLNFPLSNCSIFLFNMVHLFSFYL